MPLENQDQQSGVHALPLSAAHQLIQQSTAARASRSEWLEQQPEQVQEQMLLDRELVQDLLPGQFVAMEEQEEDSEQFTRWEPAAQAGVLGGEIFQAIGIAPPLAFMAGAWQKDCACVISAITLKAARSNWYFMQGTYSYTYETPMKPSPPIWISVLVSFSLVVTYRVVLKAGGPPALVKVEWKPTDAFIGHKCTGERKIDLKKLFGRRGFNHSSGPHGLKRAKIEIAKKLRIKPDAIKSAKVLKKKGDTWPLRTSIAMSCGIIVKKKGGAPATPTAGGDLKPGTTFIPYAAGKKNPAGVPNPGTPKGSDRRAVLVADEKGDSPVEY